MESVDVGDGDRLGLQKRKRQEVVCCSRETRSSSLKQKLEEERKQKLEEEKKAKQMLNDDSHYRGFTPDEWKIYHKQVQRTKGFDVYVPPNVCDYGLIMPFPNFHKNPRTFESVKRCARDAIDVYNNTYAKRRGKNFQFIRVVKLNYMMVQGYNYYITFEAKDKDEDAAPTCFQALVYAGLDEDDIEVEFCRRQPSPRSKS